MRTSRRGIQFLGWVSVVAGYGLTLLLLRGIFIGITRGFGATRSQAFWIVLGDQERPGYLSLCCDGKRILIAYVPIPCRLARAR
jgi:hypothetical protein